MAKMKRVTVTLPEDQVEAIKGITDNLSGYVASAVETALRGYLLDEAIRRYEEEHGAFTDEEMAIAHSRIFGSQQAERAPSAGDASRHPEHESAA